MNQRTTWAVWGIGALCIAFYVARNIEHWYALEMAQLAWRNMGRSAVFRSGLFWSFAPVATLLHTGMLHLAANLWCLAALGILLERRQGWIVILLLWAVGAYAAMGMEALVSGTGRVGLSAVTYTFLGVAVSHWQDSFCSPRCRYTSLVMLALLLAGGLEALGLPALFPEIAHVAHAAGLLAGLLIAPLLPWAQPDPAITRP